MTILPLLLETTSKYVLVNTNSVQWSWSQSSDNCPWCAAKYDHVEDGNYHDMLTINILALLMMLTITMVTMTMMTMMKSILCAPPSWLSGLSPNTSRDTNWLPLSSRPICSLHFCFQLLKSVLTNILCEQICSCLSILPKQFLYWKLKLF